MTPSLVAATPEAATYSLATLMCYPCWRGALHTPPAIFFDNRSNSDDERDTLHCHDQVDRLVRECCPLSRWEVALLNSSCCRLRPRCLLFFFSFEDFRPQFWLSTRLRTTCDLLAHGLFVHCDRQSHRSSSFLYCCWIFLGHHPPYDLFGHRGRSARLRIFYLLYLLSPLSYQ